ncbi:cytochrome c-type biogenesis protein CcmH [Pelagibacterales bacterium]|jgi:cytochrome c-type biogenesis protein CcmH|nr:cytochrome c-type biogenesis protein CcmH [Pelagibacterales bacterium]|tara:strand:+ start:248 stop:649 length:402 start_codon:yes stop_codon:yes gene_type:complete
MKIKLLILILTFISFSSILSASSKMTSKQNDRAIDLFKETRCLVCQSQTIYDSNSELATDLKLFIQEEIIAGKTDNDIKAQLVTNYGEWILMTPSLSKTNYILWFSPFIFLLIGIVVMFKYIFNKSTKRNNYE